MSTHQATLGATGFSRRLHQLEAELRLDTKNLTAEVEGTPLRAGSLGELRSELAAAIYTHLHIRNPLITDVPTTGYQDLADQLISLIPHRTVWQQALHDPDSPPLDIQGTLHHAIMLDGVKVLVPEHEYRHDPHLDTVLVRMPSWRTKTTPGFLLALGDALPFTAHRTARIYLGCNSAAEAIRLWPEVLRTLAASATAFQVKALSASAAYPRSDAMVAYVPTAQVHHVAHQLAGLTSGLPVPACEPSIFAHRVSERVSLAAEPNDARASHSGLSFGQHRSRLLAEALIQAHRQGISLEQAWTDQAHAAGIEPLDPAGLGANRR